MEAIAKYLPVPEDQATAGKMDGITYKEQALEVVKRNKDHKLKPVALFAVTQDIEVGKWCKLLLSEENTVDAQVKDIDWEKESVHVHYQGEKHTNSRIVSLKDVFKVLGPLSPNATWVKDGEGIEIDSMETICPHPLDTYKCGHHYGCDENGCNNPDKIYKVLGLCGHFH